MTKVETKYSEKKTSHYAYRGVFVGKVLDIGSRLKNSPKKNTDLGGSHEVENLVDMTERRQEALKQDRRQVKRTILTEFISMHAVVPEAGLLKVTLYDLNQRGLSFDLEDKRGQFKLGEEVAMRVYLNQQTYFPFVAKVKHLNRIHEEGLTLSLIHI